MSQTSYNQYQNASFAGMLGDTRDNDILSYSAGSGAIAFGLPVVLGTDPVRQVNPVGTGAGQGALVVGVAVATHALEQVISTGVSQYAQYSTVSVLKKGTIWVNTDIAVTAGNVANLKLSNGKFTDAAVTTGIEAFTQITVRFLTSTTAAGLALVEIK